MLNLMSKLRFIRKKKLLLLLLCITILLTVNLESRNNFSFSFQETQGFFSARDSISNRIPDLKVLKRLSFYKSTRICGTKVRIEELIAGEQKHFPRLIASYNCPTLWYDTACAINWPPPARPPIEHWSKFTMGRNIPVTYLYFAQKYAGTSTRTWTRQVIDSYIKKTKQLREIMRKQELEYTKVNKICSYGKQQTLDIAKTLQNWNKEVFDRNVLVIGSEKPWLEGMLLGYGARKVTTLEYGFIVSEHPNVQTIDSNTMRKEILSGYTQAFGSFDTAFSFSSIEHSGLGRYGDPVNPFADIEQVAQISCLIKKGGTLFLGLPIGADKLEWNAHRIYGKFRLPLLTLNFQLLDVVGNFSLNNLDHTVQPVMVLKNFFPK